MNGSCAATWRAAVCIGAGLLAACGEQAVTETAARAGSVCPPPLPDARRGGHSGALGHRRGPGLGFEQVAAVEYGNGNLLVLTPACAQVREPESLALGPIDPDDFDVFVVKSRVHFRRGFDETGYAPTVPVVDAPGPFVGTTRLEALDYEHAPLWDLYPYSEERPRPDDPGARP